MLAKCYLFIKPIKFKLHPLQVKLSSKFDPCLTSADEVGNKLKSLVVDEGNKMVGFLNKGEVSQAAQLAMSVLKAANAKSECGIKLSILVKIVVCIHISCLQVNFRMLI